MDVNRKKECEDLAASVVEKVTRMEGIMIGWYYTAMMSGNMDALRLAGDLRRDASIAIDQICELKRMVNNE